MAYLNVGDKAPDFSVTNQNGETVSLSDFKGSKLIIYFYPKADTPGCTAESCNLRDHFSDLLNRGFKIVGVSPDNQDKQKKFAEKYNLPFPLLADVDHQIIKPYGAWGVKKMYGKEYEGLLRTTYVVSEEGLIEKVITKVKTKDHAAQILEAMNN